jgi:hypothetical protein
VKQVLKPLFALVALCALIGCANGVWLVPPQTPPIESKPIAAATPADSVPPPAHKETASVAHRKHKVRRHEEPVEEDNEESPQMSVVPDLPMDAPPATISMAGTADALGAAKQSLDETSRKLGVIDRGRLSPAAATTYDQAKDLLTQGQQAIDDKDYVAASGFARKASALADKLPRAR